MGTSYYTAIGAFLQIKLELTDIPTELWDCGNNHINRYWDTGVRFCPDCGKPVTMSTIMSHDYPTLSRLVDEDVWETFYQPEFDGGKRGIIYLMDNENDCHEEPGQGFSRIDGDAMSTYKANFVAAHQSIIEHVRSQPGVISAEIVTGALGYYS